MLSLVPFKINRKTPKATHLVSTFLWGPNGSLSPPLHADLYLRELRNDENLLYSLMPPGSLGLGAGLVQDGQSLAYAVRALSEPKIRYATMEKETLAIVVAFER